MVGKLNLVGDSAGEYAKLQSFFSVMQTVGSLISGRFLDNLGVKGSFVISFVASALSYWLLSQSTTMSILYLSKVPTIFQAGFLCAQVAASQITSDGKERVAALGRLTTSYTVGMVIGPYVGGILGANGDYYLGAKLAVAGSLISAVLILFLPNTSADDKKTSHSTVDSSDSKEKRAKEVPSVLAVATTVWLFLMTKVVTSVANSINASTFPLILKDLYGANEKDLGLCMSLMSGFNALVNGVFLGPIVAAAGGDLNYLISNSVGAMAVLSLLLAVVSQPSLVMYINATGGFYLYLSVSVALSICQYVLSTTITGESTARVGQSAKGTLLGLEHSLFAAARIATPQLGVVILKSGGVSSVAASCAAIFASVYCGWNLCSKSFMNGKIATNFAERKEK